MRQEQAIKPNGVERRGNKTLITLDGDTMTATEWAVELDIPVSLIYARRSAGVTNVYDLLSRHRLGNR